jgi:HEAT repeat protein
MNSAYRTIVASLAAITTVAVGAVIAAQQPRITNGQIAARPAASQFAQSFNALVSAANDVAWIGYAVPVVDGERIMCCFGGETNWINGQVVSSSGQQCCRVCKLEPSADGTSMARRSPGGAGTGVVRLEPSDRMIVLIRVAAREIDRVRVFSEDCELDAGGRVVTWLNDVRPADSIAVLESFTAPSTPARRDRVVDGAISAIALHGDPAADASLERLVNPSQPEGVRKKVTFWLGNARKARGLAVLKRVLKEDPSPEVQKSAVFGVSQSQEPDAFETLAGLVKSDASARIRSEAVFWIGNRDDARAPAVIMSAIDNDTSAEVRKKAVFALGQLKDDRGVDALVNVARNHKDTAVRSEAIFWLGQKAGKKAASVITERIDQDPATEVKKKAVFALSQLPKDEGIPLLINVARTNTNTEVRKQAMFWLGQSRDQRAIDFFAEILKK